MGIFSNRRAAILHADGKACAKRGDDDGAIKNYLEALRLNPRLADTAHNLGLIYKYRRDWRQAFEFNKRAHALRPHDKATLWNLAIAATALRDWVNARAAWRSLNIVIMSTKGPIEEYRGVRPIKLNAINDYGRPTYVVWGEWLSPVTARLTNIPLGSSGFRYDDVVLHDGAPSDCRLNEDGKDLPVFDVLDLMEPSHFSTCEAVVEAQAPEDIKALEGLCDDSGIGFEDWTAMFTTLCRACSEGRRHVGHDKELLSSHSWSTQRRIGFSTKDIEAPKGVLRKWAAKSGREVLGVICTLRASAP